MTTPDFLAGRECAVVLAACQICTIFMSSDYVSTAGVNALVGAIGVTLTFTFLLGWNLQGQAAERGYARSVRLLAALSLVGVAVVYALPDRSVDPARGSQP